MHVEDNFSQSASPRRFLKAIEINFRLVINKIFPVFMLKTIRRILPSFWPF